MEDNKQATDNESIYVPFVDKILRCEPLCTIEAERSLPLLRLNYCMVNPKSQVSKIPTRITEIDEKMFTTAAEDYLKGSPTFRAKSEAVHPDLADYDPRTHAPAFRGTSKHCDNFDIKRSCYWDIIHPMLLLTETGAGKNVDLVGQDGHYSSAKEYDLYDSFCLPTQDGASPKTFFVLSYWNRGRIPVENFKAISDDSNTQDKPEHNYRGEPIASEMVVEATQHALSTGSHHVAFLNWDVMVLFHFHQMSDSWDSSVRWEAGPGDEVSVKIVENSGEQRRDLLGCWIEARQAAARRK
ncbi:hypothetical protein CKAH01_04790 [Colletotrichum kahawae]|uniref:Uncharacterized protein n=1 Tax=Colletotrichum kahawae TaxID=34407 RepID=A0AAD9YHE4_COLKA|nr:hypothetical protein CKAH01_04790 [Colletotrichum kahawae]